MKVLALMGSSRNNHNTDKFLDLFIERFNLANEDFKRVNLKDLEYSDCISCYGCSKVPRCVVKDDLTELYKDVEDADLIIMASPIYFNSLTGNMKNFIDRMQVYWARKFILKLPPLSKKYVVALMNGGAPLTDTQFTGAELVLDHFLKLMNSKKYMMLEVSQTDDYPIEIGNEKFMDFLNSVELDFDKTVIKKLGVEYGIE